VTAQVMMTLLALATFHSLGVFRKLKQTWAGFESPYPRSFRGAREASEPGIQFRRRCLRLDSGSRLRRAPE
jgi:hypothetical protein